MIVTENTLTSMPLMTGTWQAQLGLSSSALYVYLLNVRSAQGIDHLKYGRYSKTSILLAFLFHFTQFVQKIHQQYFMVNGHTYFWKVFITISMVTQNYVILRVGFAAYYLRMSVHHWDYNIISIQNFLYY
jgi:hypothetical protein